MNVIIILLLVSLSVATLFLAALIRSIKHKQYDDAFSPPHRMLFDNPPPAPETKEHP